MVNCKKNNEGIFIKIRPKFDEMLDLEIHVSKSLNSGKKKEKNEQLDNSLIQFSFCFEKHKKYKIQITKTVFRKTPK